MGNIWTRANGGVEEVDISNTNAYRYPPKSGCYFGSHFIMGGERFDTAQPECYLFGENTDLNFLGNRPIPFPYPPPSAHEPTKTLKSLVNIRKNSLHFQKVIDDVKPDGDDKETTDETPPENCRYNIEFTFDTDVRVAITVYYFATEEISNGRVSYTPRDPTMNSETYHYKRGANQTFSQSTHVVEPAKYTDEEWMYSVDKDVIPVVIQCVVEDEADFNGHSHQTLACVEHSDDRGSYILKPLKQKQMIDGLCYLLQEIYGIENKTSHIKAQDDDLEDSGSECVICMSDIRDTVILPCRHLCLCNGCANALRYQASCCPICRAPFRALLQVRAMRKKLPNSPLAPTDDDTTISQEGVPPGYEAVSLIEALNGPGSVSPPTPTINMSLPRTLPPDVRGRSAGGTSPDDSPLQERRKNRRRSSARSDRATPKPSPTEEVRTAPAPAPAPAPGSGDVTQDQPTSPQSEDGGGQTDKSPAPVTCVSAPGTTERPHRHRRSKNAKIQQLLQKTKDDVIASFLMSAERASPPDSPRDVSVSMPEDLCLGHVTPETRSSPPPAYETVDSYSRGPNAQAKSLSSVTSPDRSVTSSPPLVVESLEEGDDVATVYKNNILQIQEEPLNGSQAGARDSSGGSSYCSTDSARVLLQGATPVDVKPGANDTY